MPRAEHDLSTVPVSVTLPRADWLFLTTVLVIDEMRIERKRKNRTIYQHTCKRLAAIKSAIIAAERKKAKQITSVSYPKRALKQTGKKGRIRT